MAKFYAVGQNGPNEREIGPFNTIEEARRAGIAEMNAHRATFTFKGVTDDSGKYVAANSTSHVVANALAWKAQTVSNGGFLKGERVKRLRDGKQGVCLGTYIPLSMSDYAAGHTHKNRIKWDDGSVCDEEDNKLALVRNATYRPGDGNLHDVALPYLHGRFNPATFKMTGGDAGLVKAFESFTASKKRLPKEGEVISTSGTINGIKYRDLFALTVEPSGFISVDGTVANSAWKAQNAVCNANTCRIDNHGPERWYYVATVNGKRFEEGPFRSQEEATDAAKKDGFAVTNSAPVARNATYKFPLKKSDGSSSEMMCVATDLKDAIRKCKAKLMPGEKIDTSRAYKQDGRDYIWSATYEGVNSTAPVARNAVELKVGDIVTYRDFSKNIKLKVKSIVPAMNGWDRNIVAEVYQGSITDDSSRFQKA